MAKYLKSKKNGTVTLFREDLAKSEDYEVVEIISKLEKRAAAAKAVEKPAEASAGPEASAKVKK